jgi:hypothetical protein
MIRRTAFGRKRKFFALSVTQQEAVNFATSRLRSSQKFPTSHVFRKVTGDSGFNVTGCIALTCARPHSRSPLSDLKLGNVGFRTHAILETLCQSARNATKYSTQLEIFLCHFAGRLALSLSSFWPLHFGWQPLRKRTRKIRC